MTLMEMLVGMIIMGIFMAMFTGVIFTMTTTVSKVQAVTTSSAQINTAFLKLDKLVRYASAISTAGQGTNGDWYVELDSIDATSAAETCTQLRVDNASTQLQQRSWTATGTSTYTNATNWTPLANQITNGTAASGSVDQPFSVPAAIANATAGFQRLTITLTATGIPAGTATTRSQMTFTAVNSAVASTANAGVCQQAGRP